MGELGSAPGLAAYCRSALLFEDREQLMIKTFAKLDAERIRDHVRGATEGGRRVHVDHGMGYARRAELICARHVSAAPMVESAVSRVQRQSDAWSPFELGADFEEAVRISKVLWGQICEALRAG